MKCIDGITWFWVAFDQDQMMIQELIDFDLLQMTEKNVFAQNTFHF